MRDYGKVYTVFWTSDDVQGMTEDERTLALYLLTCPHGNMIGCFRLPAAYASEDMKWSAERVSKGFNGLAAKGYINRCERTSWVLIKRYLKWNQFENPNVGKAAGKLFGSITAPTSVKAALAAALREFASTFPWSILDKFEAENKPFANPSELSAETGTGTGAVAVTGAAAATATGANPVVEQTQLDGDVPVKTESAIASPAKAKPPKLDEVKTIFEFWQKVMQSPKSVMDDKRKALIVKALKNYSPADICKAIRGCSKTPHNMGENAQAAKYNGIGLILRDAENIDRFILADAGNAKASMGTMEQANARARAEFLGEAPPGGDIIEMAE